MSNVIKLGKRISIGDAVDLLARHRGLDHRSPTAWASAILHKAICCGYVTLFVDDKKVDVGFFSSTLYIGDARVEARSALVKPMGEYFWTVQAAAIYKFIREFDDIAAEWAQ